MWSRTNINNVSHIKLTIDVVYCQLRSANTRIYSDKKIKTVENNKKIVDHIYIYIIWTITGLEE
jgi:hypothetical protein